MHASRMPFSIQSPVTSRLETPVSPPFSRKSLAPGSASVQRAEGSQLERVYGAAMRAVPSRPSGSWSASKRGSGGLIGSSRPSSRSSAITCCMKASHMMRAAASCSAGKSGFSSGNGARSGPGWAPVK